MVMMQLSGTVLQIFIRILKSIYNGHNLNSNIQANKVILAKMCRSKNSLRQSSKAIESTSNVCV